MTYKEKNTAIYDLLLKTLQPDERKRFDHYLDKGLQLIDEPFYVKTSGKEAWKQYLESLDKLNEETSLLALKVIMVLLYRNSVLIHNEEMLEILSKKQEYYFANSKVTCKERIKFGINIFEEWPGDLVGSDNNAKDIFIENIERLFLEEAKKDPLYTLQQFDRLDNDPIRSYLFSSSRPVNKLKFARIVKDYRSLMFVDALSNFLDYYNMDWSNNIEETIDPLKIKAVSTELYNIIANNLYPEGVNLEKKLQLLIRHASMNEAWYGDLCVRLWEYETQKTNIDKESLKNYFLIAINCENNVQLLENIYAKFALWSESYKSFTVSDQKLFIDFINQIDKLFELALNDVLAQTRNMALPTTIERKILDDLEALCWQITEWAYVQDKMLFFVLLIHFAGLGYSSKKITRRVALAQEAAEKFIECFTDFVSEDTETATGLVGRLLKVSSRHSKPKSKINAILDHVYFMLEDIAPENAKAELDKAIADEKDYYEHFDYGGPSYWRPEYAASDPEAHISLLTRLSDSADDSLRKSVASNPAASQIILDKLSKDANEEIRIKVAQNKNTSQETLAQLSQDVSSRVMQSVGENPTTNGDILKKMWIDGNRWTVPSSAASNPSLSEELIRKLAKNDDSSIRKGIVRNSSTPADILQELSLDPDPEVRNCVAENPNTPVKVLDILSNDTGATSWRFRRYEKHKLKSIYDNLKKTVDKNTAKIILGIGFWSKYSDLKKHYKFVGEEIRRKVAANPSTSIDTLKRLLDDNDYHTVRLAKENLKNKNVKFANL